MRDLLITLWQRPLPHHFLSRIVHAVMRSTALPAFRLAFMRWFVARFGVVLADAQQPELAAYPTFNAFFTRALRPGARPVAPEADAVASPADSCVSQCGDINAGRVFQAKGRGFTAAELLGAAADAAPFADGRFATLYLSPRDYHRVHMPLDGELRAMVHVPGRLFSVSPATTRGVDRLFARNERVVFLFDTAAGRMAYVMVGALFVSSIETVWSGEVTPPAGRRLRRWDYAAGQHRFRKGDELGRFNMGSTVILLFERGRIAWDPALIPDAVLRVGQKIGQRIATRAGA
jgi:phosphatidylserine decarboxylase